MDTNVIPGTGPLSIMTGDHLHPPMVDDEGVWRNGAKWPEGVKACVTRLLAHSQLTASSHMLDVGTGVGGPARTISQIVGCRIVAIDVDPTRLRAACDLTAESDVAGRITYLRAHAENLPLTASSFDGVFSFNMFYNIERKAKALAECYRILKPGGQLLLDDWFVTDSASAADVSQLQHHWPSPRWCSDSEIQSLIRQSGFVISHLADWSYVGATLMARHFRQTFNRDFRHAIHIAFPEYGTQIADEFERAVELTIRLYQEKKMAYLQIVASKPQPAANLR